VKPVGVGIPLAIGALEREVLMQFLEVRPVSEMEGHALMETSDRREDDR
jgi:hypothetical protein